MYLQICCHNELLKKQLRDIKLLINDNPKIMNSKNVALNCKIRYQLSDIIHKHSLLLKITEEIDVNFGWLVFIQFGASCIIICLTLYQANDVSYYLLIREHCYLYIQNITSS